MNSTPAAPQHAPIYFVTVCLNTQVHMIGLGFTSQFYLYACAQSPLEAEKATMQWVKQQGLDVHKVVSGGKPATMQSINTYSSPEAIINLPKAVLEHLYEQRQYPEEWRKPGRYVEVEMA